MTDKLKPCPFCGGEAYIDEHSFYNDKTKGFTDHSYGVLCSKCFAQSSQSYETKKEAKQMWNRRVENEC